MRITIKTKDNLPLTDELRGFVEEKIEKLKKLIREDDTVALAEVELAKIVGGQKKGEIYHAEINLAYTHGFVRAESTHETLHHAIEEVVLEARTELRKKLGRERDLMRRGAMKVKKLLRRFKGT